MIRFDKVLKSWGSEDFTEQLQQTICALGDALPLKDCCKHSGVIDFETIKPIILSSAESDSSVQIKLGVFFSEILSGCACSDDPSQAQMLENGYCELEMLIDKASKQASFINV